jgi:mannose-1-phosphate guanylyltransferase
MKALILVGGYGTRLRPLTFSCAKPLVPFANKPIVVHQIEALVKVGVTEIILAVNHEPEQMREFLQQAEAKYGIKISFSKEDEPLGTAGPLALAKKNGLMNSRDSAPFFMFNSDVICTFPLAEMLDFHKKHGKEGTIFVTPVEDPSKYGVVVFKQNGEIEQFIEKPKVFVSNKINAGIYLLNPAILDRVELKPTSIEREIFPAMAASGNLYALELRGYWMDVGQPKDYLTGMVVHLNSGDQKSQLTSALPDVQIIGNVLIDPSAKVGKGCVVGPDVVIGPACVLEEGVRIQRSTLLHGAHVRSHAFINNSLIGWASVIGKWSHCQSAVFGKDVEISDGVVCVGTTICPHKQLKEHDLAGKMIM